MEGIPSPVSIAPWGGCTLSGECIQALIFVTPLFIEVINRHKLGITKMKPGPSKLSVWGPKMPSPRSILDPRHQIQNGKWQVRLSCLVEWSALESRIEVAPCGGHTLPKKHCSLGRAHPAQGVHSSIVREIHSKDTSWPIWGFD